MLPLLVCHNNATRRREPKGYRAQKGKEGLFGEFLGFFLFLWKRWKACHEFIVNAGHVFHFTDKK
jgi:hypothetical protein